MATSRDTLRLLRQLREDLTRVTDQQTRDLVAAWADAWDEVATDLEAAVLDLAAGADDGKVTRAMVLRSKRLSKALAAITVKLEDLADQAGVRISGDLDATVQAAAEAQQAIVASQLPPGEQQLLDSWSQVDQRQIDAIVRRTTKQITSDLRPLSREQSRILKRELVRGLAAGNNPRTVARRVMQRAEGHFNGGLNRALVVSRTEMLDAHRDAARVSRLANPDLLAGWVWTADLGARTCPACWSQHGTLHPVDEPGPEGHQQCRCVAVPRTKSWRDLGIDVDEPADLMPNAKDTFAALTAAEQQTILGPKRYQAWAAGRYPMSAWSTVRSTDGWRDSVVVSPAPQSGGRARSSAALVS